MPTLQWSHSVSAVESRLNPAALARASVASMEPQRLRRGKSIQCSFNYLSGAARFNGATASPPWKGERRRAQNHPNNGFNGATASPPWKECDGYYRVAIDGALQWSHSVSAVERALRLNQWSIEDRSFNGATASPPWKVGYSDVLDAGASPLQWSHSVSAVESRKLAASMLQSWLLQWSHSVSAVERRRERLACCNRQALMLQWSHSVSAVESARNPFGGFEWLRFNGATASPPWKGAGAQSRHSGLPPASMEPQRLRRGKVVFFTGFLHCPDSFNGATASPPWKGSQSISKRKR